MEFYKENYDKDYHFEIYTAGVRTVMERVRDYLSDIGFVYVMEQQKKEFQYELAKNKLVFTVMQESTATFYPGKLNTLYQEAADREKAHNVNMEDMKNFRFIQNTFHDCAHTGCIDFKMIILVIIFLIKLHKLIRKPGTGIQ